MSFSSSIKDETAKIRVKTEAERRALLCALTHMAGSMSFGRGISIVYVSESHSVAKLIAQTVSSLYNVECAISVAEYERLKARNTVVRVTGTGCRDLLIDMGCLPNSEDEQFEFGHIPEAVIAGDEAKKCFLRGAFLGGGSVIDPNKGYHMEFVCKQERFAQELCTLLNAFDLNARISKRKTSDAVYIKEGERVSDFLALIGAMTGTMEFEHARVVRSLSNDLNRQRNFEEANMQKTAQSAAQQLLDIKYIIAEKRFFALDDGLRAAAELRLNNPEASLAELACEAGINKSSVNRRLKKLSEIADTLRIEKGVHIGGDEVL